MGLRTLQESTLLRPLAISLIFHACLLAGIYYSTTSSNPDEQRLAEQGNSIEIIMVERNPQSPPLKDVIVEEETIDEIVEEVFEEITEEITTEPVNEIAEVQGQEVELADEAFPVETIALVSELDSLELSKNSLESSENSPELSENSPEPSEKSPIAEDSNNNPSSSPSLSSAGIASAISSVMATYGRRVNQDWVNSCNNYKSKHGTRDCPQQHGKYDVRPVYRDYTPPNQVFSFQKKRQIARLEFLQEVIKDSDLSSSEFYAVNQLKQHHMFLLNPEPAWTPYAAPDKFNPDIAGPVAGLFKMTDKGIWLFGIGEINFLNFEYDSGEDTFWFYLDPESSDTDAGAFVLRPPLLPVQR